MNNYYKAVSVSVFDQVHAEFLVLAQNFHFHAFLITIIFNNIIAGPLQFITS